MDEHRTDGNVLAPVPASVRVVVGEDPRLAQLAAAVLALERIRVQVARARAGHNLLVGVRVVPPGAPLVRLGLVAAAGVGAPPACIPFSRSLKMSYLKSILPNSFCFLFVNIMPTKYCLPL